MNLEGGMRINDHLKLRLELYNALDSDASDIRYFYESQLPGETAPVSDIHFHPVEPRTLRLTVEARL